MNYPHVESSRARTLRRAALAGGLAVCLGSALAGCHHGQDSPAITGVPGAANAGAPNPGAPQPVAQSTPGAPPQLPPLPAGGVRGIYLTGWTAGSTKHFNDLVNLVDRTDLNAMVIDVKDDGDVSYDVDVPLAKQVHANQKMIAHVDKLMATLKAHNIWPIARIACFRDTIAKKHPEMGVHGPGGGLWRDRSGHYWLNPYNKAAWDYNVDIALDALKHGFKEIQFDYVRFPSEGHLSDLQYPGKPKGAVREDQIAAFMKYAHDKIHAAGGWFDSDVFGLTSLVRNDEGIGQKFEKVIKNVDYLCPMVYPSHYHDGEYGIPHPNSQPYKIIYLSVGDAVKRMKGVPTCHLRPWIQAFSLGTPRYGPSQVKAQIKALNDLGVHEYLMWNAACKFTAAEGGCAEGALGKEKSATASAPVNSASNTGTANQ